MPDGQLGKTVTVKGGCFGENLGKDDLDLDKAIHLWTKRAIVQIPEGATAYEDDGPEEF